MGSPRPFVLLTAYRNFAIPRFGCGDVQTLAIAHRTEATKQKGAKRWNPLNTCKSSILQGRGITWRKTQNAPIPQQRVLISYRPARKSDTSQTAFGLHVGKKEEQRNRFTTCGKGPSESLPLRMVCASLRVGLRRVGVQVPEFFPS